MYCTRKINDDYTWVGADCRRLAMFEGVYDVPQGISFNSYLLTDEKTVLFDTVDSAVRHTFRENLTHALAGRELDYVVVHHMEPDHAAELADLLRDYPRTQVLCSAMAKTMIGQFFGPELAGRITVIKEGETLSTGRHTLHFVAAPMVHWPEVMLTYDATDKLLLSADAFGSFGALNGALFADEVNFDRDYLDEARRYYTNIVGKYGPQVQAVLKKAETLDIQMLLPLHGFVWREELGYLLGKALGLGEMPSVGMAGLGLVVGFLPAVLVNRAVTRRQEPEFTILRETRSAKWTLAAVLIPAGIGLALCILIHCMFTPTG